MRTHARAHIRCVRNACVCMCVYVRVCVRVRARTCVRARGQSRRIYSLSLDVDLVWLRMIVPMLRRCQTMLPSTQIQS